MIDYTLVFRETESLARFLLHRINDGIMRMMTQYDINTTKELFMTSTGQSSQPPDESNIHVLEQFRYDIEYPENPHISHDRTLCISVFLQKVKSAEEQFRIGVYVKPLHQSIGVVVEYDKTRKQYIAKRKVTLDHNTREQIFDDDLSPDMKPFVDVVSKELTEVINMTLPIKPVFRGIDDNVNDDDYDEEDNESEL